MSEQQSNSNNQLVVQNSGSLSFSSHLSKEDEEMSKSALSTFRAKEEEIEKKKMEVRDKVQFQLGRVEEETKRLATIREVYIYISLFYFLFFRFNFHFYILKFQFH
jgi:hypothetical protein